MFDLKTDDEQSSLDRRFFENHPHRTVYFRPATGSETIGGDVTLVAKLAEDLRLRYAFEMKPGIPWRKLNEDEGAIYTELPELAEVIASLRGRVEALQTN